jgi:hypothetical protein
MGFSGLKDLQHDSGFVAAMAHLGYPEYMMNILGVAKFLAIGVLLIPQYTRLKEWAYAGIVIDLVGAFYSHYVSGDGIQPFPLVGLVLTFGSYFLMHEIRKDK